MNMRMGRIILNMSTCHALLLKALPSMISPNRLISRPLVWTWLALCACWCGCQTPIDVTLPGQEPYLVLEGRIEPGEPPIVLLSRSQDYFAPVDAASLGSLYRGGADVVLEVDGVAEPMVEICAADLGPTELALAAELLGFPEEVLMLSELCAYTSFTTTGEVGRTYGVMAALEGDTVSAMSRLNPPVPLDSLWFGIPGNVDTLGVIYGLFDDPDSLGNAYRLSAARIGRDPGFLYPTQSAFDDVFFNGVAFEFTFFRPVTEEDFADDADPAEIGFYKIGDTVAVRWDHIDRGAYETISSMEEQIQTQGSPFANPSDVSSNVDGGLGLWVAYSPYIDTVICIP